MPGAIEQLTALVEAQTATLAGLADLVRGLSDRINPTRETYTLADLAVLPESPSLKTLRNNPDRQPNGGVPDGYAGSKKAWRRETVEAWRRQLSKSPLGGGA